MMDAGRDLVIVGGGPAGLTAAIALVARAPSLRGRLVVLEAATYPREKPCAGAIGGRGDRILEELDARPDVPSVYVDGISLKTRFGEASARVGGIGRVIRRLEFDAELAAIARRKGVTIVEGARVTGVTVEANRARVATSKGDLDAAIVIGADGVGSVVRRAMGLGRGALRAQVLEVDTPQVDADRPRSHLHFDASDVSLPGYAWDFPTLVDGERLVSRGVYHLRMADEEIDLAKLLGARLDAIGLDLSKCKNKRYAERGYERDAPLQQGPLLLAGEAAGIDPITGEGIAQAIEHGALAGRFVADAAVHGAPLDAWGDVVKRSRLSLDLTVRTGVVPMFYGRLRERMERFLGASDTAIHVGCQHFGGLPIDQLKLAKVGLQAARHLAPGLLMR
jgi:flavin-dependent dehydrogenase